MGRHTAALTALLSGVGALLLTAAGQPPAAQAAPYCTGPGVPVGCVARPAVRAATPGAGAPGVGVTPGVGPNAGGPANRPGRR